MLLSNLKHSIVKEKPMGKRGKVLGVLFAAVLIMVGNVNAYAASSANWNVNY